MDVRVSLYDSAAAFPGEPARVRSAGVAQSSEAPATPLYDTYDEVAARMPGSDAFGVKVVKSHSELAQVWAIRAAVFVAEQKCPYHEEFDDNDMTTHLIAYRGREPIETCRIRWFAGFAKLERMAVRQEHRNTPMSFGLVRAAIQLIRRKGYCKVVGQSQDRLLPYWRRFGFRPVPSRKLVFSDFSYTEIVLDLEPDRDAITLDTDPYVMIRPEGQWHKAGVLEE